jgi:hypothetical protein
MIMELLDIEDFLLGSGYLPILTLIAGCLFAVQAVFTCLMWRKGDETYFLKFISLTLAAVGLILAGICYPLAFKVGGVAMDIGGVFLAIAIIGGAGIQAWLFIRDTWFAGDGGEKSPKKGKTKAAKSTPEEGGV